MMNHRQILESCLEKVLANLPDERLREVFDFAEFLSLKEEQSMWSRPSPEVLAQRYAGEEQDYSTTESKPQTQS